MMTKVICFIFLILGVTLQTTACTIALVSGKHTPDGRPIMWKHRDTGTLDNKVVINEQGLYRSVILINSEDSDFEKAWIGFNEAGFAIMNSASYNLRQEDTVQLPHNEGILMREALENCATVEDFETFLHERPKPMGIESNFGVMDAKGNIAYFETDNFSWTKIDVNDLAVAPHGYIVRSNFSFTGRPHDGAGYIRFETAEKLFYRAAATANLSIPYMVKNMAISLENAYSRQDARDALGMRENQEHFMYYQDCINRYTSSSSVFIQGVNDALNPLHTTMWAMVGFPMSSVAIPVWITPDNSLPAIITAPGDKNALICDMALELKNRMVPSTRGSTKYYINAVQVYNADNTGITQQLIPVNQQIIRQTNVSAEKWPASGPPAADVTQLYRWIDDFVKKQYHELFNINLPDAR
ncbi:MAG: hypothetical protein EA361_18295 [Bacteroidetes bacterium]|nr:MAG: hypothetical protein EA361_18295 [Bacteroidota bacterium]